MKKSLLLGAMALAASAATASAAEYGFYSTYGGAYCDGLKFSGKAPAVGQHIYDQVYCVYTDANTGGFESKIKAIGPGKWFTFPVSNGSGDGSSESYVFTFYANTKALEWVLAYESTDYGITFSVLNEGTLQSGPPFAHMKQGAKHLGSVIHESMAKIVKK
jgi:opacity protein-like surface antigen